MIGEEHSVALRCLIYHWSSNVVKQRDIALIHFIFILATLLEQSAEDVSALTIRIELTTFQWFSTGQGLKGLSVNHYDSLLYAKQILGTECILIFSISPLLLSMSLQI